MYRSRAYRRGTLAEENFSVDHVSEILDDPEAVVWVDLCEPQAHELHVLAEELHLHRLALEDAGSERQRPKLDRYDSHLFLSLYEVVTVDDEQLTSREIAVFVTERALVTVRKSEQVDIDDVVRRWDSAADLATHGVPFLLHGLLDHVVDSYFEAVQSLDDEVEELEDLLFADQADATQVQRRAFRLRKSLVLLRRVVVPMREVVNAVMRRDLHIVNDDMTPYYQDVYDHVLRATEWTESLRDLVSTILDTNLTIQGNQMNLIMKRVTSWAAVIAVPTAITGFYGQNVPYPGYGDLAGLWTSVVLTVSVSVLLYAIFRRRDWM
jgi:magnesium transporter